MTEPPGGRGQAPARAALAGNPSDGYRGAVVAVALPARGARAQATPDGAARCEPESALVRAAVARFGAELDPRAADASVRWCTDIPRGVGLGGSSAIVIAVLRALGDALDVPLAPLALAPLALSIEVDDLEIAAGLQDRVAQAFGGVTFMDFAPDPPAYTTLESGCLPPLLVAWRTDSAGDSGMVHAPLRDRHAAGELAVVTGMRALAGHARGAAAALRAGDRAALRRAVDGSLDARAAMIELDPRHVAMIDTARSAGAAANYAGSGGAIVAVCDGEAGHRERVADALAELGCETLVV